MIPRITDITDEGCVFQLAACILAAVPKARSYNVDALVVVNGQGELWRTQAAVNDWNHGAGRHLIVTGAGTGERTCRSFDLADLQENFGLLRTIHVDAQGYPVPDTRDHARWVMKRLVSHQVQSAAIYASLYHLPRVYLTLLKNLIVNGLEKKILLFPRPVEVSPFTISPESEKPVAELFAGEAKRIIAYAKKGDIASLEECMAYLEWLWDTLP